MSRDKHEVHVTVGEGDEVVVHRESQLSDSDRDPLGLGVVSGACVDAIEGLGNVLFGKGRDED